jgi:hypothetical protein
MHKNQINYLYSIFVFVLITIYSFSSLTAEAGFITGATYSIHNSNCNYRSIRTYFLEYNAKCPPVYNEYEPNRLQLNCNQGKSYAEDLRHCCIEQKNHIQIKKNKKSISLPVNSDKQTN